MILDIGPDRVMMGSDFPWYDLDHSIDRVFSLPLLSIEEKERIVGANAVEILGL
jgi:predicted TIM-barrel fold metal-dependent hydrolase